MKIEVLHCGYIQVSEAVPFGNDISLKNTARQLAATKKDRGHGQGSQLRGDPVQPRS